MNYNIFSFKPPTNERGVGGEEVAFQKFYYYFYYYYYFFRGGGGKGELRNEGGLINFQRNGLSCCHPNYPSN